MSIYALTIWQPWASLIAIGAKPYEFRSWPPPAYLVGKRLAIHAGARAVRETEIADLLNRLEKVKGGTAGSDYHPCLVVDPAIDLLRRTRLGLAEAKKPSLRQQAFTLPTSHIIATAIVGKVKRGDEIAAEFGATYGDGNASDPGGTFNWGWPLTDVRVVMPPVPAKGSQGLWGFSGALEYADAVTA